MVSCPACGSKRVHRIDARRGRGYGARAKRGICKYEEYNAKKTIFIKSSEQSFETNESNISQEPQKNEYNAFYTC